MRDVLPVGGNLKKERTPNAAAQMDGDSKGIRHQNQIRENTPAAQEHISLTRDKLDRSERPGECFE